MYKIRLCMAQAIFFCISVYVCVHLVCMCLCVMSICVYVYVVCMYCVVYMGTYVCAAECRGQKLTSGTVFNGLPCC